MAEYNNDNISYGSNDDDSYDWPLSKYIEVFKKEHDYIDIFGDTVNATKLCDEMNVNIDALVYQLLSLGYERYSQNIILVQKLEDAYEKIKILEKSLSDLKENGVASDKDIQNTLVKNGKSPNGKKAGIYEVARLMKLGLLPEEIMEHLNISLSTYKRRKKEIKERGGVDAVLEGIIF